MSRNLMGLLLRMGSRQHQGHTRSALRGAGSGGNDGYFGGGGGGGSNDGGLTRLVEEE